MLTSRQSAMALTFALLTCCGRGEEDRQEQIDSLRTFGVSAEPLVSPPSDEGQPPKTVLVTLYAAVPLGQSATVTAFVDRGSGAGAVQLGADAIAVQAGSEKYIDFNNFRLFSAQAKLNIPTAAAFHMAPGAFKGAQIRYGLTVTAPGWHEDVIANLLVFPDGTPEASWKNPTVAISSQTDGAAIATGDSIDLKAVIDDASGESPKVGWFVSKGEVSNRRASETKWKLTDKGPQTIAVAVHSTRSRGFALKVINVTGQ